MNKYLVLLSVTLWGMAAVPVYAESVTLREAVGRALENNHHLRAAAREEGAARESVAVSRSRYLPRLYLDSGVALSTTPSTVFMMKLNEGRINPGSDFTADRLNHPDPRADFATTLTLDQPLLDFGISTGVDVAAKEAEGAALRAGEGREEIAFRVSLAYFEVLRARAYNDIAALAVADAREHERLASVRERDGLGLKSDTLRAATALSEAEQRLMSARNNLTIARLRLNLLAGGKEGEELDAGGASGLAAPAAGKDDLVLLAQRSRPDLAVASNAVQLGELGVRQAKEAYLPTVHAQASYQVNDRSLPLGYDNDSWTVGVSLRWEIFDGLSRSHERSRAELKREAAAELLENGRREAAVQVKESLLRRQEAELRLASAQGAVRAAEEGMRLITLRFQNGLSSMVELLDAEAALNGARANLIEVENGLQVSSAEVYFRAGVLVKEVMK
ncbi:RND transporter [Geomonas sp. Red276]